MDSEKARFVVDEESPAPPVDHEPPEGEAMPADGAVGPLEIDWEPGPRMSTILKARWGGSLFHSDAINLVKADPRREFVKEVARKAERVLGVLIPDEAIEDKLMEVADKVDAREAEPDGEEGAEATYEMVESDDPDKTGIYRITGERTSRLTNFTARIDEDVLVHAEGREPSRRIQGHTWLDGERRPFAIPAADFVNNEKLQATLTTSAGSGAVFLEPRIPPIRAAMGLVGRDRRASRIVTADHGWHGCGADLRYHTLNGFVDTRGFHTYGDDPGILRVDLQGIDVASRLGLQRLEGEALVDAGRHLVDDYLQLHGRPVMLSLASAGAYAVLEPFAGKDQRCALWLKGLTGAGKSYAAKTTLCFFGDFDPGSGRQYASWAWTANAIEKAGYAFRGAPFLVDDFKLELMARRGEAIRVLQLYADDQGRGRLYADTRSAPVWPIRGLLLATGEDVPQNSASSLGRMIVVDVPNRPKDLERGRRCRERRRDYPGVMADFIAHQIRSGRIDRFQERVEECTEAYYKGIEGRANDARIAGNFGALAAAGWEFAAYLGHLGVWPEWEVEFAAYQNGDLFAIRDTMLHLIGCEQPSAIFLAELRNLVAIHAVRLRGWPPKAMDRDERTPLIGRIADGRVEIIPEVALAEVQKSLRAQGRPELAVTKETLLEQLVAAGHLLNRKGETIRPEDTGRRLYQQRIFGEGSKTYVAAVPKAILGMSAAEEDDS
jgi:hypothetical protein